MKLVPVTCSLSLLVRCSLKDEFHMMVESKIIIVRMPLEHFEIYSFAVIIS